MTTAKVIYQYVDAIALLTWMGPMTRDDLVEKLRETGAATPRKRSIDFSFEADDLWDLRDKVEEAGIVLGSFGYIDWQPNKHCIQRRVKP